MARIVLAALFSYQSRVIRHDVKVQIADAPYMKGDNPMHFVERGFELIKGANAFDADGQTIHIHVFTSQVGIRKNKIGIRIYPRLSAEQSPNEGLTR